MSGNQALVRLPIQQRIRDRLAGFNTAGMISGYRGSPLGRYDMELWQAGQDLRDHDIHFQPGVNEDLAATAVWGSQFVPIMPKPRYDGVFGIWYGKGPGVDRSGDAFKHANAAGTSVLGGVIALAGDDHGAKSSTQAHQSDQAFVAAGMPILYPSNVQDILDFGLHGLAMSRYAGCWVGIKLVTDVVEGSSVVEIGPASPLIVLPPYPGGGTPDVHIKRFEPALLQEARLYNKRIPLALTYARANALNRIVIEAPQARIGIVTAGKSYADTSEALAQLGLADTSRNEQGVRLLKIGMVWPLDPEIVTRFAKNLDTIIVIEEKRPLLEEQLKAILFDAGLPSLPRIVGKFAGAGVWSSTPGEAYFPLVGELNPTVIAARLASVVGIDMPSSFAHSGKTPMPTGVERFPTFCSGCPHSTSTRLPDGSLALAAIGCASIAFMTNPAGSGPICHMGAEGAMWVGQAPFTDEKHVFANIGDGTYFHSGFLAIRQSVAAKVSITYKLLLNGFVSMTGGQPIEGELTPSQLATELLAEGVAYVVVVTDDPDKYASQSLPSGVPVFHRELLDTVQRDLRERRGVSVLIYDQMCATERRRQRKRGRLPDPDQRIFISAAVCEGCGNCGEQSNCLSVEPYETELGRKRRINQASCNKDYSCVQGHCPSFVTIRGGKLRRPARVAAAPDVACLPEPILPTLDVPQGLIITGIGGTGVITVGAILGMAAHIDGKFVTTLDLTGLAQKYGAVMSHIHLARNREQLYTHRLAKASADVVLGCDLIVTAGAEAVERMDPSRTRIVVNTEVSPTREFPRNPDWQADGTTLLKRIQLSAKQTDSLAATRIARELMGDPLAANMLIVGFAWQRGWIAISSAAIKRAITLNGVSVDANLASFNWGRLVAHDPSYLTTLGSVASDIPSIKLDRLDAIVADRSARLTAYQNDRYAARYRLLIDRVAQAERRVSSGDALARTVAHYYFKLLAHKDAFEVARLYASDEFRAELERNFEGDFTPRFHLSTWPFSRYIKGSDIPRKREVGTWILPIFGMLARLRFLRGTFADPLRGSAERRLALDSLATYEADVERLIATLSGDRIELAEKIAAWPEHLRGYGHVRLAHAAKVAAERETLWQGWGHLATSRNAEVPLAA